jgi:hypothetical protein
LWWYLTIRYTDVRALEFEQDDIKDTIFIRARYYTNPIGRVSKSAVLDADVMAVDLSLEFDLGKDTNDALKTVPPHARYW